MTPSPVVRNVPSGEGSRPAGILDAPPKTTFMLGLFVGVALTALGFIMFGSGGSTATVKGTDTVAVANTNTSAAAAPTGNPSAISKPTNDDHYLGAEPSKAKVVLVEFSDFQCPYCSNLHPTLQRIVDENPETVSLVYRHFPLTSIHPQALPAANASECAAEQDKFWEFGDKIFATQSSMSDSYYSQIASDIGLNIDKFNDCYQSKKYDDDVQADMSEGELAGVSGTPATFVLQGDDVTTGQLISGALPYASFKSVIDQLL